MHRTAKRGNDMSGTTPIQTMRPSGARDSVAMPDVSVGSSSDALLNMMRQTMSQTTVRFESTEEKLDATGG